MSKDPNTLTAAQNVRAALRQFGWRRDEIQISVRNRGQIALVYSNRQQVAAGRCLKAAGFLVEDHIGYLVVEA